MGAWDTGPFDNDSAADWGGDLDDAAPEERAELIRAALTVDDEDLEVDSGQEALAAAAVVAAVRRNAVPDNAYWPDFLTAGEKLDLPDDLAGLALRALDLATGPDSELHELWTEDGPNPDWDREIAAIRAGLQP